MARPMRSRRGAAAPPTTSSSKAAERGVSASVLPLAMVALQNNTVVWIDEPMVRRELGADRADLPGLGFFAAGVEARLLPAAPDASRRRRPAGGLARLPRRLALLGAALRRTLPPGVINVADFTQSYFPAEIDADFSIIPEDELPALLEDALALPPIDLTLPGEALDSTAVAILAPVPATSGARSRRV